jgi:hypothetical protein
MTTLRRRWADGQFPVDGAWRPIMIPLRSPSARDLAADYGAAQEWVAGWRGGSERLRVEWGRLGGRLIGVNEMPIRVWIDTPDSLWSLVGAARDVARFRDTARSVIQALPELAEWLDRNQTRVLAHEAVWPQLTGVVLWLRDVARPGTHVRQIDVAGVDTKFVERHQGLLAELLDRCLPPERIATEFGRHQFVRRYRLSAKPTLIRLRRLDGGGVYPTLSTVSELALRAEELACTPVPGDTVFVVENEVSYLAFPYVPGAVAIHGSGYAVSLLTSIDWLEEREIVYWGDIDTHGFAILDRLRARFRGVRSLLMDRATLLDHESYWGREPSPVNTVLPHLTPEEARLYVDLLEGIHAQSLRLEQERIRFGALRAALTPWTGEKGD